MINLLTFSYKLVRADSFYIFYFFDSPDGCILGTAQMAADVSCLITSL